MTRITNKIRVGVAVALSLTVLILIPSLVQAIPINTLTFETADFTATLDIEAQQLSGGQWMYTYSLTNLSEDHTIKKMYIGWDLGDGVSPPVAALELGVLGADGEIAASYVVPPDDSYTKADYNGIQFYDWGVGYSSYFKFKLEGGQTLDTVYVIYEDFVSSQAITVSGSKPDTENSDAAPPVPEPGTLLLLGTGLFSLGVLGRRKFKSL
jgi:hypothetical protein